MLDADYNLGSDYVIISIYFKLNYIYLAKFGFDGVATA